VLFCVYTDGLLNRLAKCHVGCYIGLNFLGALAYTDDIVLLAPTPSAIRKLLNICDGYTREGEETTHMVSLVILGFHWPNACFSHLSSQSSKCPQTDN